MADITFNGMTMEYSVVESMMDSKLKDDVQSGLAEFTEQSFLDAYMEAHKLKFGKDFLQS